MEGSNILASAGRWTWRGTEAIRALGRWWLGELSAMLPNRVANWLLEKGTCSLVIVPHESSIELQLLTDRRRLLASNVIPQDEYSPDRIDSFLESNRQPRARVPMGIRMPPGAVFFRSLHLPIEVRRSLAVIVAQDTAAKTPFEPDDVYHAHTARVIGQTLAVRQWIVRRKHVKAAADALGLEEHDIAFVEAAPESAQAERLPAIDLGARSTHAQPWVRWMALGLTASAIVLACATAALRYNHQQDLLDALAGEVAVARTKAQQTLAVMKKVEGEMSALGRVRSKRKIEPGLLDVWQETTRVLPDRSWLTELRVSESSGVRHATLTGYSPAAAALVALVDRSELLAEASLVAPIAFDQTEDRERFSIQAVVKRPGKSRTALK